MMNPAFKVVLEKVEENRHAETNDHTFNGEKGKPKAGLIEMASRTTRDASIVVFWTGARVPSSSDSDEGLRELGAVGAG